MEQAWRNQKKETNCLAMAFRLQPELGTAQDHYRIGQLLESLLDSTEGESNRESAIYFYQQAVKQDPNFVPGYERLADLLEDKGDWQEAVACYRKVLDLTGGLGSASAHSFGTG